MKLTPKQQAVMDYLVQQERLTFKKTGKEKIYPNTKMIEMVFEISRQRANKILDELQRRLDKNFRQKQ